MLAISAWFRDTYDMQYAQVLINSKTDELERYFSYKIPPELLSYISVGSVVKIPFGSRNKIGIVAKITRRVSPSIIYKLKNIESLEYKISIFSETQFKLAKMISNYYLTSLGRVIFFMLPKLSKRIISKYSGNKSTFYNPRKKMTSSYVNKNFTIFDNKNNRIKHYTKLIKKSFANNKSAVLLFPDFEANKKYVEKLKKNFFEKTIVFSPTDSLTRFTKKWIEIQKSKSTLIIGTRNTLFISPENTGLIIIDEPNHFGYKEEQTTHHNIKKVAQLFTRLINANLIYGDSYPQALDILDKNNKNILLNKRYITQKKVTILDNSQNKNNFFTYPVERIIENHINKKQTILILVNSRGMSAGLICNDCEELFYCPRCQRLLYKKNIDSREIICPVCNYMIEIPQKCPNCGGKNINEFGLSTNKIEQLVNKKIGAQYVKNMGVDDDFSVEKNKYVFISTNYALAWKNLSFDSVLVLDWENWCGASKGYNYYDHIIKNFIDICEISTKNIFIQTTNPENNDLIDIAKFELNLIIKKDLQMKEKFKYPPYYQIIEFYQKALSHVELDKNLCSLKEKVLPILKNCEISEIIETGKKRDKYRASFLIRYKHNQSHQVKKLLIDNYKKLKLSQYIIDVDPINIG